eukprot:6391739-Prymnesium_polylepis.1
MERLRQPRHACGGFIQLGGERGQHAPGGTRSPTHKCSARMWEVGPRTGLRRQAELQRVVGVS